MSLSILQPEMYILYRHILASLHVCIYLQNCTNLWRWNTGTGCVTVDMVDGFLQDHSLLSEALQVL